jgi:NAD(P)-dependent dehydrogenase (short-subunit alcohol dehydrogenase family)
VSIFHFEVSTMSFNFSSDLLDAMPAFEPPNSETTKHWENKSSLTKHRDTYSFIDPYRFKGALNGKIALVTQAHRGVGRSTALAFAQAGASVCCLGPTAESLETVLREIKQRFNTPTMALTADLMDPDAAAEIVSLVEKYRGPIDILVNITPASYLRPFGKEADVMKDWWPVMEATLRVPITLIHAVLPSMVERQTGVIISAALPNGIHQLPFMSAQSVAAASIIKFHHQLDAEYRSKGVLSFAVNPGPIPSLIHDPSLPIELDPEHLAEHPEERDTLHQMATQMTWSAAGLASGTFLMLCAEPRAKILSGLYVNAERDLEELIGSMEKDWGRKVKRDRLYVLKVDEM